jgi:hypothetical protein
MAAHKIGELLTVSGELKALSREARRLAEVEQLLFEAAPRALAEAARVKSFRAGTLVLSADNTAVAAKLRQLAPRLLVHVRKREPEVSGIRVEVQPASPEDGLPKHSAKRSLAATAITNFESLAAGLRDSPLKGAVTRLVQRHKKR